MKGVKTFLPMLGLTVLLASAISDIGCSSSKWAGNWKGVLKPGSGKQKKSAARYDDTKPIMTSTLVLSGDGSYTAKIREVNYTGDWKEEGQKITLTPKTFMGMTEASMPPTKKDVGKGTMNTIFQPVVLEESADGKTLTHTDENGTDTYTKAD
jgi:hypothetical protein